MTLTCTETAFLCFLCYICEGMGRGRGRAALFCVIGSAGELLITHSLMCITFASAGSLSTEPRSCVNSNYNFCAVYL